MKVLVGSRLHFTECSQSTVDDTVVEKVVRFVENSFRSFGKEEEQEVLVAIAVGASSQVVDTLREKVHDEKVMFVSVQPWGKFVPGLNALVGLAVSEKAERLVLQSLEVQTTKEIADALLEQVLQQDTLVCGLAFPGDHVFVVGEHCLDGRTSPWNTLAVWNVDKLWFTGFPMVGDGNEKYDVPAGVEEVTTISLVQKLFSKERAKAKLLRMDTGLVWDKTFGGDPNRKAWHEKKMQSKIDRPKTQLSAMELEPGFVEHVVK